MVVSVQDIKDHLKIQYNDEDALLERLSIQAQGAAEDFCRTTFDVDAAAPVKLAIMLMVAHYYENRDNPDKQVYLAMRLAFENLLYPHRNFDQIF